MKEGGQGGENRRPGFLPSFPTCHIAKASFNEHGTHRRRPGSAPCAQNGSPESVIRVVLSVPGSADKPRLLTVMCAQVRPLPPWPLPR